MKIYSRHTLSAVSIYCQLTKSEQTSFFHPHKSRTARYLSEATVENTVKTRISLIQKNYAKNKPLPVIAEELETNADELRFLYDNISKNPEKTTDEIYQIVFG